MGSEKLLFRLEQPHGLGDVYIAWQKGSGNYLATTGVDSTVNIFDRYGQIYERIRLQGLCSGFGWDSDGDILAIICQSSQLVLWDANTSKKHMVDIGLRDAMTCILWAKSTPLLAVGTAKGNVSIYNHATSKRTPIIGKHSKKITCGSWNRENLLALGSEDKTFSISSVEGDTLRIVTLRGEPSEIQFSEMKLDERLGGENTVSLIVAKRTLYLYNMVDPENPIELSFQQHYGLIVTYKWFGDGYILVGFSAGYFIAISTHIKEVGQELFQVKNHKNNLTDICICNTIGKVASCGDNTVKIHDIANLQETSSVLSLTHETGIERIAWSSDGQLLAVSTRNGSLNVYVSYMSVLSAVCGSRIAVLSSLTEVNLYNFKTDNSKMVPIPIALETEPSFIAVGSYHLTAGMNSRAWFYDLTKSQDGADDSPLFLRDRQYLGVVTSICLNVEYASVLYEGKIQLHMIEQPEVNHEDRESIIFPDSNSPNVVITCHALTTDFLIYGTDMGELVYFCVEDWMLANDYTHSVGIKDIFADPAGTRLVFVDMKTQAYVFNNVINELVSIPNLPSKITGIIWDSSLTDRNIFVVYNDVEILTYIYNKLSIYGPSVQYLGITKLVSKQVPLFIYNGDVQMASSGGLLTKLALATHESAQAVLLDQDEAVYESLLNKQLKLHRFQAAWHTCQHLKSVNYWKKLAKEALINLEINLAIRCYKQCEDVALVNILENILDIEDYRLIAGYSAMFLNDYDCAQQWFLSSSYPKAALEMRRDLLQWDQALQLSRKMASDQIPYISREYAQQLEFIGNYSEAYLHYEKGLQENIDLEHILICKCGIARTAIQCNNYKRGIDLALELDNKLLFKECAEILEHKNQIGDAGMFYEKGGLYEKAASNYIKYKNWHKVGELLPNISSNKIHLQYAKAKESEGRYDEACKAYYVAKDYDSVIRLQLDYLNSPETAVELVQETKSAEGAKMVARFFQRLGDYPSAIRFLVISKCNSEAFDLARKHGKLQLYGEVLLSTLSADELRPQDFLALAEYFEIEKNNLLTGKYFYHAHEFQKALKYLLKSAKNNSEENEAITCAIDVVASSNDESLANELIEYLLGEADGVPKDAKYLFRLYMARRQYKEASKSAIIIANEEQINGNYRNAHDILFSMYQELKQNNIRIPNEMYRNLMLLHSYILVRLHVRKGDHLKGARMLIRVSNNISKFPSHIVPILTSTVIECHRAGLKNAAYNYASMLIQNPDYRKQVDVKYSKKIEGVVRKQPKNGKNGDSDVAEQLTPCPYCESLLAETEMYCDKCKNNIPFCIATGRHIIKSDFTVCPECDFPAIQSELLEILQFEDACPMCSEKIDVRRIVKIEETKPYLLLD
ncbi:hypothetical protein RN001_003086 [Aquatica leii]|uniref:WD repeat-containing protein 19 n=1 Tax=Aquatica leii TaxID=1421715 RepID=A0AAN7SSY7_9COLE|nr:hypothetical protein RN001_003086 [Aquatica leii]